MPTILAVLSDLHVGSTVALSPRSLVFDDGDLWGPSPVQNWINDRFDEYVGSLRMLKAATGYGLTTLINGELADDNYHRTTQQISRHPGDIVRASLSVLEPLRDISDELVVTRGSEAHVGSNSSIDEALARAIGATPDDLGRYARWNYRGVVDGVRIDAEHHPGTGSGRPWTTGAAANRLVHMVQDRYIRREMLPPHLILRGHNHRPEDSSDNHGKTRAIITPSWQLDTAYGHRLGGDLFPIGGMYFILDEGKIVMEKKMYWDWPLKDWSEL